VLVDPSNLAVLEFMANEFNEHIKIDGRAIRQIEFGSDRVDTIHSSERHCMLFAKGLRIKRGGGRVFETILEALHRIATDEVNRGVEKTSSMVRNLELPLA